MRTLALFLRTGDVLGQANCIGSLGNIALTLSNHEEARALYEEAKLLFVRVGSILGQANCTRRLGDLALARSDHEEARVLYEESLALYTAIPHPYSMGGTHVRLARVASSSAIRSTHAAEARRLWTPLDRSHLLHRLDAEFGPVDPSD